MQQENQQGAYGGEQQYDLSQQQYQPSWQQPPAMMYPPGPPPTGGPPFPRPPPPFPPPRMRHPMPPPYFPPGGPAHYLSHGPPNEVLAGGQDNVFYNGYSQQPVSFDQQNNMQPSQMPGYAPQNVMASGQEAPCASRDEDDKWINNWLQKTGALYRTREPTVPRTITIPEASAKLRQALLLLEQLQDLRESVKTDEADKLNAHYMALPPVLTHLTEIKKVFQDEDIVKSLVKKLDRAARKRRRTRRQKLEAARHEQERQEKREMLHMHITIDQQLAANAQKLLDKKKEEEVKASADSTLSEVRRKLQEASKAVDMISALVKLRSLRKQAANSKGLYSPLEADNTFNKTTEEMEKLLKSQLQIYEDEKKTLEVMLEMEQEEDREKEQEIQRQKTRRLQSQHQRALQTWLFGPSVTLHPEDPLHKFREYYEVGERDIHAFINIREAWDSYLVPEYSPEGSRLPIGWVQPVPPSSAAWQASLQEEVETQS